MRMGQLLGRVPLLRGIAGRLLAESVRFSSGRSLVVGKLLAEGGFSFVYLTKESDSGQQYALKKMVCQDSEARASARKEADMHERFSHENLLPLVDKSFHPHSSNPGWEICWLVFPLYKCSLRDEISRQVLSEGSKSNWTVAEVLEIMQGICRGVQEMHCAGVAHRDVKPENVLLPASRGHCWAPVLMDFGSCGDTEVPIQGRREAMAEVELAAQLCTMQYRAPELYDMPSDIGVLSYALADVWSVGCTGYCCILGYSPFEVEFDKHAPYKARQVECSHLRILGPIPWPKGGPRNDTPEWLKDTLRWILAVDPKARPDVGQVLERLRMSPRAGWDAA